VRIQHRRVADRLRHLFPSEVREAVSMLDRMVAETAENREAEGSTSGH
jgi:hypothetical protein